MLDFHLFRHNQRIELAERRPLLFRHFTKALRPRFPLIVEMLVRLRSNDGEKARRRKKIFGMGQNKTAFVALST
jgi:hypothetical protein